MCRRFVFIALCSLCIVLSGCRSASSQIYILQAESHSLAKTKQMSPCMKWFGLGPVEIPTYLDTPQIITRRVGQQIYFNEFARWGEPLANNIREVLGKNLMAKLPISRVVNYPWIGDLDVHYRLQVELNTFDVDSHGLARLNAHWYLTNAIGDKIYLARRIHLQRQVLVNDNQHVVASLNANLNRMSTILAKQLRPYVNQCNKQQRLK